MTRWSLLSSSGDGETPSPPEAHPQAVAGLVIPRWELINSLHLLHVTKSWISTCHWFRALYFEINWSGNVSRSLVRLPFAFIFMRKNCSWAYSDALKYQCWGQSMVRRVSYYLAFNKTLVDLQHYIWILWVLPRMILKHRSRSKHRVLLGVATKPNPKLPVISGMPLLLTLNEVFHEQVRYQY